MTNLTPLIVAGVVLLCAFLAWLYTTMWLVIMILSVGLAGVAAWFYTNGRFLEGFGLSTRVTCPTRNMSHDLRGDPITIPKNDLWPLGMSEVGALEEDRLACEARHIL
jgi:hypothetical protein